MSIVGVFGQLAAHDERHVEDEQRDNDIANDGGQRAERQRLVNAPPDEGNRRDEPFDELNRMHPDSRMNRQPRKPD